MPRRPPTSTIATDSVPSVETMKSSILPIFSFLSLYTAACSSLDARQPVAITAVSSTETPSVTLPATGSPGSCATAATAQVRQPNNNQNTCVRIFMVVLPSLQPG